MNEVIGGDENNCESKLFDNTYNNLKLELKMFGLSKYCNYPRKNTDKGCLHV